MLGLQLNLHLLAAPISRQLSQTRNGKPTHLYPNDNLFIRMNCMCVCTWQRIRYDRLHLCLLHYCRFRSRLAFGQPPPCHPTESQTSLV